MSNKLEEKGVIKEAVIDHVEKIVGQCREKLEKIVCVDHGLALKKLDFNRETGRFDIQTCCENGERLVQKAISEL